MGFVLIEYLMVNRENFGGAHMSSIVVVGTQWGDEGKGKITDFLAEQADVIARFQEVITQVIRFNLVEKLINYI